jgi:dephospho-CoA kinase
MLIIGLTGSIGMGKSTAAAYIASRGVPVFDADGAVHALFQAELVVLIEAAFPGTTGAAGVDRPLLREAISRDPRGFERLNAIVHPRVRSAQRAFLREAAAKGASLAVVDVPLLLEGGGEAAVDFVLVVSADASIQRERVLGRPGMTEAALALILARQMSDANKRARADFIVDTSGPVGDTQRQIDAVLAKVAGRTGTAYQQHWA